METTSSNSWVKAVWRPFLIGFILSVVLSPFRSITFVNLLNFDYLCVIVYGCVFTIISYLIMQTAQKYRVGIIAALIFGALLPDALVYLLAEPIKFDSLVAWLDPISRVAAILLGWLISCLKSTLSKK